MLKYQLDCNSIVRTRQRGRRQQPYTFIFIILMADMSQSAFWCDLGSERLLFSSRGFGNNRIITKRWCPRRTACEHEGSAQQRHVISAGTTLWPTGPGWAGPCYGKLVQTEEEAVLSVLKGI